MAIDATYVVGIVVTAIAAIWGFATKVYIPRVLDEKLAAEREKRQRIADDQEHKQELEEVSANFLIQASITNQSALITTQERLTTYITDTLAAKIDRLEREVSQLRGVALRSEGREALATLEMSRLVDLMSEIRADMHGIEPMLEGMKSLLALIVRHQPVMTDDPDDPEEELERQ